MVLHRDDDCLTRNNNDGHLSTGHGSYYLCMSVHRIREGDKRKQRETLAVVLECSASYTSRREMMLPTMILAAADRKKKKPVAVERGSVS